MVAAEADEIGGAERAEVADVATDADVVSKEEHGAAAKVPRGFAVVEVQHVRQRIDLRSDHADTRERIRSKTDALLSTDWNAEEQVAGCGEHAAVADVGLAVEVRTACD